MRAAFMSVAIVLVALPRAESAQDSTVAAPDSETNNAWVALRQHGHVRLLGRWTNRRGVDVSWGGGCERAVRGARPVGLRCGGPNVASVSGPWTDLAAREDSLSATSAGGLRTILAAMLIAGAPVALSAQTPPPSEATSASASPPAAVWASATLGPGRALKQTGTLLGAQAALFGSYGRWAFGIRRGGASGIDSDGAYDNAVLIGWRSPAPHSTLTAMVGPAEVFDESSGIGQIGFAFATEAGANIRFVGVGLSMLGAWRPNVAYISVGLTLDAGFIR